MRAWLPKSLPALFVVCVAVALSPGVAGASSTKHLAGTWSGSVAHAMKGDKVDTVHIRIVIDAAQTGGSWYVSSSCRGTLSNDGISWGYHHYIEHLAKGSTCVSGATDCLQRQGANLFDNVTPPPTVDYTATATLKRAEG